jgi:hypothetical protein
VEDAPAAGREAAADSHHGPQLDGERLTNRKEKADSVAKMGREAQSRAEPVGLHASSARSTSSPCLAVGGITRRVAGLRMVEGAAAASPGRATESQHRLRSGPRLSG